MFIPSIGEKKTKGKEFLRMTLVNVLEVKVKYNDDSKSINEELKNRKLPYVIKKYGRGKKDYRNRRFCYIDRIGELIQN